MVGSVTVTRAPMAPQALRFRDSLFWRDVVDAHKDGIARVLLGGKATVTVRELSRLELRQEQSDAGIRYSVDLLSGKVRTTVAHMLMLPTEQVQVRTRNAVSAVRGTDLVVETTERPSQGGVFGLLGARELTEAVAHQETMSQETLVTTLSGAVDVVNPLSGTGRAVRTGPYEGALVRGTRDPVRFQFTPGDLLLLLRDLVPPRPAEVRTGDKAQPVVSRIEHSVSISAKVQAIQVRESISRWPGNQSVNTSVNTSTNICVTRGINPSTNASLTSSSKQNVNQSANSSSNSGPGPGGVNPSNNTSNTSTNTSTNTCVARGINPSTNASFTAGSNRSITQSINGRGNSGSGSGGLDMSTNTNK